MDPARPPRVVLTAAPDGFAGLADLLRRSGCSVIEAPLIAFAPPEDWGPFDRALAAIQRFEAVAVTSPRAAAILASRLRVRPCSVPAWTTGAASAQQLTGAFRTIQLPGSHDAGSGAAEALAEAMIGAGVGSPVLFPCGSLRRDALIGRLAAEGISTEPVPCYRTVLASPQIARTACADADALVVASPSVARLIAAACDRTVGLALIAVGPTTAAAAAMAGWSPACVAEQPTAHGVHRAVLRLVGNRLVPP